MIATQAPSLGSDITLESLEKKSQETSKSVVPDIQYSTLVASVLRVAVPEYFWMNSTASEFNEELKDEIEERESTPAFMSLSAVSFDHEEMTEEDVQDQWDSYDESDDVLGDKEEVTMMTLGEDTYTDYDTGEEEVGEYLLPVTALVDSENDYEGEELPEAPLWEDELSAESLAYHLWSNADSKDEEYYESYSYPETSEYMDETDLEHLIADGHAISLFNDTDGEYYFVEEDGQFYYHGSLTGLYYHYDVESHTYTLLKQDEEVSNFYAELEAEAKNNSNPYGYQY